VVVDLVKPDRKCAKWAAEGHLTIHGEVVEHDLYLKHVEGVEGHLAIQGEVVEHDLYSKHAEGVEGQLAIDSEEGVDPGFEVMPVEVAEGVAESYLAMHAERQGEDVEGVEEGHLAIDFER